MKRLRLTNDEVQSFIEEIKQRLIEECTNRKVTVNDLTKISLEDIKKDLEKVPKNVKKPTIAISTTAYVKMLELVYQSEVEISWHGLVNRENNTYFIYDILVFPQINSSTTTTGDEEKFAKWQMELISDPNFPYEDLRMHGHSHVNMNVFSSGVDDKYQEDILTKVEDGDYYIFLILNKRMEICILLYDFEQQILFVTNDVNFEIVTDDGELIVRWAEKQIKENCKIQKDTPNKKNSYWEQFGGYYDERNYGITNNKKKPVFGGKKNGSK